MPGEPPIELNRERSLGAILLAAAQLYRRYPLLFAILALAVMAPFDLAVLAASGYGPLRQGHETASTELIVLMTRNWLVGPLISALHIHAVVTIGEGRRPSLRAVARRGLNVLPVVVSASIMSALGIALGFVAFIIPGVVLALRWAVVAQAAAVEEGGWLDSLVSSRRLTKGNYAHVLSVLLAVGAFNLAISLAARAIPAGSSSGVGSVSLGIAIDTAVASFTALTLALLYFDLGARPAEARKAEREYPHLRDLD